MKCVGIKFTDPIPQRWKKGKHLGPKGFEVAHRRRMGAVEKSMDAEFEKLKKQQRNTK